MLTHKIQGMLYYALLNYLQSSRGDVGRELLLAFGRDENAQMSDEYIDELVRRGLLSRKLVAVERDLRLKANMYSSLLASLPPLCDEITIVYESQKDGSMIHRETFRFDGEFLREKLKFAREYWEGKRGAYAVSEPNRWKCHTNRKDG